MIGKAADACLTIRRIYYDSPLDQPTLNEIYSPLDSCISLMISWMRCGTECWPQKIHYFSILQDMNSYTQVLSMTRMCNILVRWPWMKQSSNIMKYCYSVKDLVVYSCPCHTFLGWVKTIYQWHDIDTTLGGKYILMECHKLFWILSKNL